MCLPQACEDLLHLRSTLDIKSEIIHEHFLQRLTLGLKSTTSY